jgi:putative phosphoserine phosphatase/1-acylglycerol-3-phosphate O-acyltransferase
MPGRDVATEGRVNVASRSATAAIFDLDRTLIPGSAGLVLARHLRQVGLALPVVHPFDGRFQRLSDTWLGPQLARLCAQMAKGWPVDLVAKAAEEAGDELAAALQPFAPQTLTWHRSAGHRLLLATLTPEPLAQPLATRLGLDDVIAPVWAARDGVYTGRVDGRLPWGRQKVMAVRDWARAVGIDLLTSYAYSANFFDGTLLAAVGHPTVVNPSPPLHALARLEGWPARYLDLAAGVTKIGGRELQEWFRWFNRAELVPNARFVFDGVEHVPRAGPVILVFNHRSYFDPVAMSLLIGKTGRSARFLGKREVFDVPVAGRMTRAIGGIRVERASGSEKPFEAAAAALEAGEMVVIAPQGTIPRGPAFFDPELKGRWGAARLAAQTRAPVIPVGLWGTEEVWPRSNRLPRLDGRRPLVTVRVGPEVMLVYDSLDADTRRIMGAIVDLLPPEARQHRTPTEQELARTYPPGYRGEASEEGARRPGTDT